MLQTDFGSAGSIAFESQPGTFDTVDGELVGSMGALSVRCSPGASPTLTLGSGANDDAGVRRMASGSAMIPYRLFTNTARDDEIIIGRQLSLGPATDAAITVPIYARASNPNSVAQAGSYSDVVQITLSW
jgi:spore coat protein U-like protein